MDNKTLLQWERLLEDPYRLLSVLVKLQKERNKLLRESLELQRKTVELSFSPFRVEAIEAMLEEIKIERGDDEQNK